MLNPKLKSKTINYDFERIEDALWALKKASNKQACLNKLKAELNKFFSDSECVEIVYSKNDKLFFGMCVYPDFNQYELETGRYKYPVVNVITGEDDVRIRKYIIDIDSQLFSPKFDFNKRELTAILLHEVGHMVNDTIPIKTLRKTIDKYQIDTHKNLNISQIIENRWVLNFGLMDALRKITSMFENEEVAADEFVHLCGYGEELESVLYKLKANVGTMMKIPNNKLIVLAWTLRLNADLAANRIPAIRHLNKASRMTGSTIEKRYMDKLRKRLEIIDKEDSDMFDGAEEVQEGCIYKKGYLFLNEGNSLLTTINKMKYGGIKAFGDDYYEFFMRMKNVEDEDDALLLMRQINTRISILTEYLEEFGAEMEEAEKKKYFNILDKFTALREKLANKTTYRDKGFNLIVTYPDIVEGRR